MLAPFHAPTCKAADATVSIIQPQFSCSWATCYGSVVKGAIATGCLICLMGLLEVCGQMACCVTSVVSLIWATAVFQNNRKFAYNRRVEWCIIFREKEIYLKNDSLVQVYCLNYSKR